MGDRTKRSERSVVAFNFQLHIPVQFSISSKPKIIKDWKDYLKELEKKEGKKINASEILRTKILSDLEVKNESELLRKYPSVRQDVLKVRHSIVMALGLYPSQFSKYGQDKMLEEMGK